MLNTYMMDVNSFINDEIFDELVLQEFNFNNSKGFLILKFTFDEKEPQSCISFIFVFDKETENIKSVTIDVKGTVQELSRYRITNREDKEAKQALVEIIRYYFTVPRIHFQFGKLRVVRNLLG